MEKKCERCGYTTEDENATYCTRCGGVLKDSEGSETRAVWQSNGSPYENAQQTKEALRAERLNRANERKKTLFTLSFVGLLLDFLMGIGWFLCLPVAICAATDIKRLLSAGKKPSTWHIWATTVGFFGALFGLFFFLLML